MLFVASRLTRAAGRHEQADLLLVRLARVDDRHELAAVHDADAVGQLEHLVELGRDEQDRRARVAALDRLAVDELDAADVEPARRLVQHEQLRLPCRTRGPRPPSAGCRPRACRRSRRSTASGRRTRSTHSCARLRIASSSRTRPREYGACVVVVEHDVVGEREATAPARTDGGRPGRTRRRARGGRAARPSSRRGRPARPCPRSSCAKPDDRLDQLVLAVAGHPGDAEDLAGAHLEAHAVHDLVAAVVRRPGASRPASIGVGRLCSRRGRR